MVEKESLDLSGMINFLVVFFTCLLGDLVNWSVLLGLAMIILLLVLLTNLLSGWS
jgi:putative flippase GtrA